MKDGINSNNLQKKYNSGKEVLFETKDDVKEAKITVHHSSKNASYIKIPISNDN